MNASVIKSRLSRNLSNIPGWTTRRKLMVIESDDWGSIRIPSRKTLEYLSSKGIFRGDEPFNLYENLASSEDLHSLFDTLNSFTDAKGNPGVFTAVCVVANPDFKKIKEHDFREYFYEPITDTINRFFHDEQVFQVWEEGIEKKLFIPQFHGREHLNVGEWMRALQNGDKETHLCFDHEVWAITRKDNNPSRISYQSAFDFHFAEDLMIHRKTVVEGLELFRQIFGYKASFFVPPNGPFNRSLEEVASLMGIKYISTSKIHKEPLGNGRSKVHLRWLGQRNRFEQIYTTRNCIFEPIYSGKDWVDSCLCDMEVAFKWHKPAIISSHRANYIGVHNKANRVNGLKQLNLLLRTALNRWPDIEFITSAQLGQIIEESRDA